MTDTSSQTESEEPETLADVDVVVLSGNPDDDGLAAITAVLTEVLGELAAEQGRRELAATSAWARSQRTLRTPQHPQAGAWRSFSG